MDACLTKRTVHTVRYNKLDFGLAIASDHFVLVMFLRTSFERREADSDSKWTTKRRRETSITTLDIINGILFLSVSPYVCFHFTSLLLQNDRLNLEFSDTQSICEEVLFSCFIFFSPLSLTLFTFNSHCYVSSIFIVLPCSTHLMFIYLY